MSKWCFSCNSMVALHLFGTRMHKGECVPKSWCRPCCNEKERIRRLKPEVKEAHREYCKGDDQKEKRKIRDQTPAGREVQHRANHNEAGQARQERYAKGPKAPIRKRRYKQSEKGIAARRRDYAKFYAKPENRVCTLIGNLLRRTIDGNHYDGSIAITCTGLATGREVLTWLMETAPHDLDPDDPWHIDHIIPRKEYDHTDADDVLRCWNYQNLQALQARKNLQKGAKLYQHMIQLVPVAYWPKKWNGVCPV